MDRQKGSTFSSSNKGNKIIINRPHKGKIARNMNSNHTRFKPPNESKTNEQSGRIKVEVAARPPV